MREGQPKPGSSSMEGGSLFDVCSSHSLELIPEDGEVEREVVTLASGWPSVLLSGVGSAGTGTV